MQAAALSGIPPLAQFILYGILGLGITGAAVISYIKGLKKEKAGEIKAGLVIADGKAAVIAAAADAERIVRALDQTLQCVDRLDNSLNRSTDALRDSTETSQRLYRHMAAQAAMPVNEEILILLRALHDRMQPRPGRDRGHA